MPVAAVGISPGPNVTCSCNRVTTECSAVQCGTVLYVRLGETTADYSALYKAEKRTSKK